MKVFMFSLVICAIISSVVADVYMHNPRGSNNRLNERSATRANNNRLFDSQNNARGGYNVGDAVNGRSKNEEEQYRMRYFQSGLEGDSELVVEWTNQHGCGGDEDTSPHKLNCNLVLQFMCQDDVNQAAPEGSVTLRNGQQTNTQNYNKPKKKDEPTRTAVSRRDDNVAANRGLHESWEWYDFCYRRERNLGLFVADQELNSNKFGISSSIFTRQNPNENRRGYECPEERDYYPYFHPTPWVDIAVLAHNSSSCEYYKENSFNERVYGECVEQASPTQRRHWSTANNPENCTENGGQWVEYYNYLELAPSYSTEQACLAQNIGADSKVRYKWGKPYDTKKIVNHENIVDTCFVLPPPLDCKAADWSRVNHLGNGRDLTPLNYTWILPHFPSGNKKRCVLRLRYNISTDDYDPFNTDAGDNQLKTNNVVTKRSPIEQNPLVNIGADDQLLKLAINTAQTGRTFQDRSHVFFIESRPDEIPDNARLVNLNVRGKRGNIVQVYPAVEYDFIPNRLHLTEKDYVHIQWTGSNTHLNAAPGGDGATGSDGEGKEGSDRNNLVQTNGPGENFPVPYENSTLHKNMDVVWNSVGNLFGSTPDRKQLSHAIQLASSNYFHCDTRADGCGGNSMQRKDALQNQLNNATPSFSGFIAKLKRGVYYYMCSRNNNFTNRSQKGQISVQ